MHRDSARKKKKAIISPVTIKVVKQRSYDDLTQATSSSNSIRRRKTDFDVQSMNWTTASAKDFVTSYLRLKVKHQRMRHLCASVVLGDVTVSPSSLNLSGSYSLFKSSLSVFTEQVHRRSPKEVLNTLSFHSVEYSCL